MRRINGIKNFSFIFDSALHFNSRTAIVDTNAYAAAAAFFDIPLIKQNLFWAASEQATKHTELSCRSRSGLHGGRCAKQVQLLPVFHYSAQHLYNVFSLTSSIKIIPRRSHNTNCHRSLINICTASSPYDPNISGWKTKKGNRTAEECLAVKLFINWWLNDIEKRQKWINWSKQVEHISGNINSFVCTKSITFNGNCKQNLSAFMFVCLSENLNWDNKQPN